MKLLMRKLDLEDVDIGCLVLLWGMWITVYKS